MYIYTHTQTSEVLLNKHENDSGPESPEAIKLDTQKYKKYIKQAVFYLKIDHTS